MSVRLTSIGLLVGSALLCPQARAASVNVFVYDFDFSTDPTHQLHIDPVIGIGDTVHWIWDQGFHSTQSVHGISEVWDSGDLGVGSTYDHTFTHLGAFQYYCDLHGGDNGDGTAFGMRGTVTVVPEPAMLAVVAIGLVGLASRRRRGREADLDQEPSSFDATLVWMPRHSPIDEARVAAYQAKSTTPELQ